MSCEEWKERLIGKLYEDLGAGESEALSRHLDRCGECTRDLEDLSRTRAVLGEVAPVLPASPRVVLLDPGRSRLPFLAVAASLAGIGLLSGLAVAFAWQARGTAEQAARSIPAATQATSAPSTMTREEMERWLETRLAKALEERALLPVPAQVAPRPEADPRVTKPQVEALLARIEHKMDRGRAADVQYLLGEMAAVEARTGLRLGETQQAIRYLALASDPRISEQ